MDKTELKKRILSVFMEQCDGTLSSDEPKDWYLELHPSSDDNVDNFVDRIVDAIDK